MPRNILIALLLVTVGTILSVACLFETTALRMTAFFSAGLPAFALAGLLYVVEVVREEFDRGDDFAQKITYKTTGNDPRQLIQDFRMRLFPRIAVTVDMIATGTDIKPIEIVMFMRTVKSRLLFDQMKGRGVRVIDKDELKAVTPDAGAKERFVKGFITETGRNHLVEVSEPAGAD